MFVEFSKRHIFYVIALRWIKGVGNGFDTITEYL